ncbi:hypothetical protein [Spartinivicinus ruber]|uniref:hypothetical protein n=1 Tax=Spartinivicinus ruber TaxID=2683272 RepID=UPI0013D0E357|nr:hypothetical protein [Spartinivicinus ruber]
MEEKPGNNRVHHQVSLPPQHLRALAHVNAEVQLEVNLRSTLDVLEVCYPTTSSLYQSW